MKLNTILVSAGSLVSVAAMAIPEPYFMRAGELTALLNNAAVKTTIQSAKAAGQGSGYIDGLRYLGADAQGNLRYTVDTGNCTLAAVVRRVMQPGFVGPGKIEIYPAKQVLCSQE